MGSQMMTRAERAYETRQYNQRIAAEAAEAQAARTIIARKIAMVLTDQINAEIIRPGPLAEERECYEMSQELRDFNPEMVETILAVLNTEGGVK